MTDLLTSLRNGRFEQALDAYLDLLDQLASAVWIISILLCSVLVLVVCLQVFTRYVLGFTPLWGGELSRYLAIWFALLMAGPLIRDDDHLQVELLFDRLPMRAQIAVRAVQLLLISGVGFILFNWGWIYATTSGFRSTAPAMGFDMFYAYLIFPLSGVLIMAFSIGKLLEIIYYPETIERDYQRRFEVPEVDD